MSGYTTLDGDAVLRSEGRLFNAQSVADVEDVVVLPLALGATVVGWTPTDRLLALESPSIADPTAPPGPSLLYSMKADGTDRRTVPGAIPACINECVAHLQIRWSPNGRWIAFSSRADPSVTIRNADSGEDLSIALPERMSPWSWSPDSERLLLVATLGGGFNETPSEFYVLNVDGADLLPIGSADEVSWRPSR